MNFPIWVKAIFLAPSVFVVIYGAYLCACRNAKFFPKKAVKIIPLLDAVMTKRIVGTILIIYCSYITWRVAEMLKLAGT